MTESKAPSICWDDKVPGLGIRQNKRGEVWVLKYRIKRRQVVTVLGPVAMLDDISARALAMKMKWEGSLGLGPAPNGKYPSLTFSTFSENYIEFAKIHKSSWLKDKQRLDRYVLPVLGKRRLRDINKQDLQALHAAIGRTAPTAANRTLEDLHRMFNLARRWGLLPEGSPNPVADIDWYQEKQRTRWLTEAERERLALVLNKLPQHKRVFFWMLLATGWRFSEMFNLQWKNVDLKGGSISIPTSKNGEPHWSPLAPATIALLKSLPQTEARVFPSFRADKCWQKVRREAQIEDVRIHDLRHTMASMMAQSGFSMKMIGEALNHKSMTATFRYAHLAREHLRQPMEQIAGLLPLHAGTPPEPPAAAIDTAQSQPIAFGKAHLRRVK